MRRFWTLIRRYLVTGSLTLLPISVTIWVILWVFNLMDAWAATATQHFLNRRIPGIGFVVTILVILGTGAIATNVIGRRLFAAVNVMLERVPFVRSVYGSVRQLIEAFTSPNKAAFKQVVMLEYPRQGIWSIGFLTSENVYPLSATVGRDLVAVFIPTTPNPTTGFFLAVPTEDCIRLPMSVQDGFKLIISGGAITPPQVPVSLAATNEYDNTAE